MKIITLFLVTKKTTLKTKILSFTGGTGFLGMILIEKLLRCCSELTSIYILVRPKKGQDIHNRLEAIFSEPVSSQFHIQGLFRNTI